VSGVIGVCHSRKQRGQSVGPKAGSALAAGIAFCLLVSFIKRHKSSKAGIARGPRMAKANSVPLASVGSIMRRAS
jgi:hypothetical protein